MTLPLRTLLAITATTDDPSNRPAAYSRAFPPPPRQTHPRCLRSKQADNISLPSPPKRGGEDGARRGVAAKQRSRMRGERINAPSSVFAPLALRRDKPQPPPPVPGEREIQNELVVAGPACRPTAGAGAARADQAATAGLVRRPGLHRSGMRRAGDVPRQRGASARLRDGAADNRGRRAQALPAHLAGIRLQETAGGRRNENFRFRPCVP